MIQGHEPRFNVNVNRHCYIVELNNGKNQDTKYFRTLISYTLVRRI